MIYSEPLKIEVQDGCHVSFFILMPSAECWWIGCEAELQLPLLVSVLCPTIPRACATGVTRPSSDPVGSSNSAVPT